MASSFSIAHSVSPLSSKNPKNEIPTCGWKLLIIPASSLLIKWIQTHTPAWRLARSSISAHKMVGSCSKLGAISGNRTVLPHCGLRLQTDQRISCKTSNLTEKFFIVHFVLQGLVLTNCHHKIIGAFFTWEPICQIHRPPILPCSSLPPLLYLSYFALFFSRTIELLSGRWKTTDCRAYPGDARRFLILIKLIFENFEQRKPMLQPNT